MKKFLDCFLVNQHLISGFNICYSLDLIYHNVIQLQFLAKHTNSTIINTTLRRLAVQILHQKKMKMFRAIQNLFPETEIFLN